MISASGWHPGRWLIGAFAAAVALGTLLLSLPWASAAGRSTGFVTALFTATSAVCVNGLTVVDTGTHWSGFGQAVIIGLAQLGGFGMMTAASLLGLVVNRQMRLRSRLLLQAESRAPSLGEVRSLAWLVLGVTLAVQAAAALVLSLRWALGYERPWGEALAFGLFHAISSFNNAGFSTLPQGFVPHVGDGWLLTPLMAAALIGGLGFPVLHELLHRRRRASWSLHARLTLQLSLALTLGGALFLLAAEWHNPATLAPLALPEKLWAALFSAVATRSVGLNVIDTGALGTEALLAHHLLMFIGAGSAGTGGGVKVGTFAVLLLIVWSEVRGHRDVELAGRRIAGSVQRQALTVLVLSGLAVVLGTMLLIPLAPPARLEIVVFEVISAFCTVGLSTGLTAQLQAPGQLLLVLLMFVGRVGIVTLAATLALNAGRRDYRYPEEKPLVG